MSLVLSLWIFVGLAHASQQQEPFSQESLTLSAAIVGKLPDRQVWLTTDRFYFQLTKDFLIQWQEALSSSSRDVVAFKECPDASCGFYANLKPNAHTSYLLRVTQELTTRSRRIHWDLTANWGPMLSMDINVEGKGEQIRRLSLDELLAAQIPFKPEKVDGSGRSDVRLVFWGDDAMTLGIRWSNLQNYLLLSTRFQRENGALSLAYVETSGLDPIDGKYFRKMNLKTYDAKELEVDWTQSPSDTNLSELIVYREPRSSFYPSFSDALGFQNGTTIGISKLVTGRFLEITKEMQDEN